MSALSPRRLGARFQRSDAPDCALFSDASSPTVHPASTAALELTWLRRLKTLSVFGRTAWMQFINWMEWNDGSCSQKVSTVSGRGI